MLGGIKKYPYLCSAKKERDGLCHQRTKTLAGHRALSEFAKKETLRIVPQQFLTIKRDTVQLTYPIKLKTSMELFDLASPNDIFNKVLRTFF